MKLGINNFLIVNLMSQDLEVNRRGPYYRSSNNVSASILPACERTISWPSSDVNHHENYVFGVELKKVPRRKKF